MITAIAHWCVELNISKEFTFKSHFIIFIYFSHDPKILMQNPLVMLKSDGSRAAHVW